MRKTQRGAAVLVAILIVTLAASTAAFAIWQQSLWIRQLENISDRAKADQFARAAIDIARDVLKKDKEKDGSQRKDDPSEYWAQPSPPLPGENAVTTGQLTDEQGRFNLNNLIKDDQGKIAPEQEKIFKALLSHLNLKPELADNVADWINVDPNGTVDQYYLSLNPPYRAAHQDLVDVAELARIKDFDDDIVSRLTPFVTALPKNATPINVNTASEETLTALFPGIAETLKKQRPFETQAKLQQALSPNACTVCDVKSEYFTVTIRVKSGRVESGYTALLDRSTGQWPSIKWRKDTAD